MVLDVASLENYQTSMNNLWDWELEVDKDNLLVEDSHKHPLDKEIR